MQPECMISRLSLHMFKFYVFIGVLLGTIGLSYSQDIVVMKSGHEINCRVQEISSDSILFELTDSGVMAKAAKSDVKKIIFSNGIEEYFGSGEQSSNLYYDHSEDSYGKPKPKSIYDKIILMDGTVLEGQVLEKLKFGINYVAAESENSTISYIANSKVNKIVYTDGTTEYISGSPNQEKTGNLKKDPKDFSYLSHHYVSAGIGLSVPIGLYSSTGNQGGFAGLGMAYHIDASFYPLRGFGFGALVGGSMHTFKNEGFRASLSASYPNSTSRIGNWNNIYTLGGIGYFNDFGRLVMDYKGLLGAMYTFFPSTTVDFVENNTNYHYKINQRSISFAFGAHAGLRYYITRKWSVKAAFSILVSKARFKGLVVKKYENGNYTGEELFSGSQNYGGVFDVQLSQINLEFGVAYTIGK